MNQVIRELNVQREKDHEKQIPIPTLKGSTIKEVADNLFLNFDFKNLKIIFDEFVVLENNEVCFITWANNVIKIIALGSKDGKDQDKALEEINNTEKNLKPKEKKQFESKLGKTHTENVTEMATHTFEPGAMGVSCDDMGFVEKVRPHSQASAMCIFKGSQILKVGGDKYSKEAVHNAEKSGLKYEVAFKVPRHVSPNDMKGNLAASKIQRDWKKMKSQSSEKEKGDASPKDSNVKNINKSSSQVQNDDNALRSASAGKVGDSPQPPA